VIDRRSLPRLVDELVWTLRREGLVIAPSQVLDLGRALSLVGWDDRGVVHDTTMAIVVQRRSDERRFDAGFAAFFGRDALPRDLWERLRLVGFDASELDALREALEQLESVRLETGSVRQFRSLLEGGSELDQLLQLATMRGDIRRTKNPLQVGFVAQRAASAVGLPRARARLAELRQHLRGALGERGDALADALARELDERGDALRKHLRAEIDRSAEDAGRPRPREDIPFVSLSDVELQDVRRAVRSFGDRLRGRERVRARRARRGRIDPGRTLRASLRTGGVPFTPARRRHRRDKPRLFLLCDVSESVRTASRFMLELVYAAQELFPRTRSFVFVSELGETTSLFEDERRDRALAAAYGGGVVPVTDNSNYGRVLRAFEDRYLASVDHRSTVVVLGDGRTNYHDASEGLLERIRTRAKALYWFCTEPRSSWASGDSAMPRYAPFCTAVFEVTTARELEEAARTLAARR
jgi:uncharacterized protein with von Willebrand factor type A (vWA) domain